MVALTSSLLPIELAETASALCKPPDFALIQDRSIGRSSCIVRSVWPKRFVYTLKNSDDPPRYYTGVTSDVAARLAAHNEGHCRHTANGRLWHLDIVIEFADPAPSRSSDT